MVSLVSRKLTPRRKKNKKMKRRRTNLMKRKMYRRFTTDYQKALRNRKKRKYLLPN
jgi:uncharacterized protein YigA (DUF484 family)